MRGSSSYCVLVVLLLCIASAYATGQNCQGTLNVNSLWTDEPVLLNTVANGKLYLAGGDSNPLYILHLYGTPYDMGLAHGLLLREQITSMLADFDAYIDEQVTDFEPFVKNLPVELREIIEKFGFEAALEYEVLRTQAYVKPYFDDELKGLAKGIGISYGQIRRFNMFPELIKAACSIMGVWGNATKTGGLYHLRALDWGTDNPFRRYALLSVYHPDPTANLGHPFVTLGWTGLLGALTGYSNYVAAGEKVWIKYNGTYDRAGTPWNFVFRDMLQFDESVSDAVQRLEKTERTCSVFLGIGDHKNADYDSFKVVEYSHDYLNVFDDLTPFPGYAPTPAQHPLMHGVVYVDKHTQPSSDPCMASLIENYYGNIGEQEIINLVSLFQTGDMHIAIFDYNENLMYVALADQEAPFPPPPNQPAEPAYNRQFIKLDVGALLNMTY